jgi:hypothetical protein
LISLPRPTQMLHFGQFALPSMKQGSVKRDLIRKSRDQWSLAPTPGLSQLATSFVTYQAESFPNRRLCTIPGTPYLTIAAPEILREHFRKATYFPLCQLTLVACFCDLLHDGHRRYEPAASFTPYFHMELHDFGLTNTRTNPLHKSCPDRKTKEVIQPQVPLRLPCYDFSPVADPRFDSAN